MRNRIDSILYSKCSAKIIKNWNTSTSEFETSYSLVQHDTSTENFFLIVNTKFTKPSHTIRVIFAPFIRFNRYTTSFSTDEHFIGIPYTNSVKLAVVKKKKKEKRNGAANIQKRENNGSGYDSSAPIQNAFVLENSAFCSPLIKRISLAARRGRFVSTVVIRLLFFCQNFDLLNPILLSFYYYYYSVFGRTYQSAWVLFDVLYFIDSSVQLWE